MKEIVRRERRANLKFGRKIEEKRWRLS